jgi:D-sedoheptulose 7-phosphate isomerase
MVNQTFDLSSFYSHEFEEHARVLSDTQAVLLGAFTGLVAACTECLASGGKVLFFGNGGSAADAQNFATELCVRYKKDRASIAALALTTDSSVLTATGNDLGFDQLFARQIEGLGKPGDMAIGISTSGTSPNVVKGLEQANVMGLNTAALTGREGGVLPALTDHCLIVPSNVTARIQEMHILLGQMLCGALEIELGLVEPD